MSLLEFILLAFSSLFVIIDPVATVPAFLAMSSSDTPAQRVRMARLASIVSAIILLFFALTGRWLFRLLGLTLPAFQIAGSIVLLLVALDMLRARRSPVLETREETHAGAAKDDIAITPLAVPMLAGPGAIVTAILLHSRADGVVQQIALCVCIIAVCAATFIILALSAHGAKWLNPIAMKIVTRVMGLLLAAVAIQFMVDGVKGSGVFGMDTTPVSPPLAPR
jgi:multiple antibiotic resistance protein